MKVEILTDQASMASVALLPADLRDGRELIGLVVRDGITGGAAVRLPNGRVVEISGGVMKNIPSRIGRPPITEGDPREKKSITLRRSTWEMLEGKRQPGESLAACIDRLLSRRK